MHILNIQNSKHAIKEKLIQNFPFTPTNDQQLLIDEMSSFLDDDSGKKIFILKGYAGTGKTSFIKTLVKTLPELNYKFTLLAPTGRAAKVITDYTNVPASTIHRCIYEITPAKGGNINVRLSKNEVEKKIYIVDEASMIASGDDRSLLKGRNLLDDLFSFVFNAKNCSIIFIGDTAQLPPVGEVNSIALDELYLQKAFRTKVYSVELKEVVRQARDSGILMNATALRILIGKLATEPVLKSSGFNDIELIYNDSLHDSLEQNYSGRNSEQSLIVCRSNKQANKYNSFIRNKLFGYEDEICTGDRMMVVKNNYFWLGEDSSTGFIANGDIISIRKVIGTEKKFGFHFADVIIEFADYPGEGEVEVKLLLDTINAESPSLGPDKMKKLFEEVYNSFPKKVKAKDRLSRTYSDPYFNALQVKFSYAVTCHKAQGGQWPVVYIDSGFMNEAMYNTEYLRWLYTAVTRATSRLLFVNFDNRFFRK
jgi:ATP-dependent exoDNAse (exonuclease V) alpha subunit